MNCSKWDCNNKATHTVYNLEYSTNEEYCSNCSNEYRMMDNVTIIETNNTK